VRNKIQKQKIKIKIRDRLAIFQRLFKPHFIKPLALG